MKRILSVILVLLLLCGCSSPAAPSATEAATSQNTPTQNAPTQNTPTVIPESAEIPWESRFSDETLIRLAENTMDVTGPNSLTVFGSHDIIYYEDRDTYDSGNPYGEGKDADKHQHEAQLRVALDKGEDAVKYYFQVYHYSIVLLKEDIHIYV